MCTPVNLANYRHLNFPGLQFQQRIYSPLKTGMGMFSCSKDQKVAIFCVVAEMTNMSDLMPCETTSAEMEHYLANSSIRTSVNVDWPLLVRVRREPASARYIRIPGTPDPWLVVTTGGDWRKVEVRDGRSWRSASSGPGDLAITSPHRITEIRWASADGTPIETIHLCIAADLFYQFATEVADCDPRRIEVVDSFAQNDVLVQHVAMALARELEFPQTCSRLLADSAAGFLTAHILQHYAAFPIHAKHSIRPLSARSLRDLREYVDAHLSSPLTLDDLARVVHMSTFHFARLFRISTGETPHAFVTALRMERAKRLLRTTASPVAAVAQAVGFSNKSHFAAAFRRSVGLNPASFRAVHGRDQ
jgi:AraC family transcriptional regulator